MNEPLRRICIGGRIVHLVPGDDPHGPALCGFAPTKRDRDDKVWHQPIAGPRVKTCLNCTEARQRLVS